MSPELQELIDVRQIKIAHSNKEKTIVINLADMFFEKDVDKKILDFRNINLLPTAEDGYNYLLKV